MNHEWHRGGYTVSTDPARLDLSVIHGFLTRCYWAEGIPIEIVRRSIEHSLNFGVYQDAAAPEGEGPATATGAEAATVAPQGAQRAAAAAGAEAANAAAPQAAQSAPRAGPQVAFARVITDRATFGYLGDVFVLEPYRGRGLSKFLMECVNAHPELQGFRRWVLLTRDAHRLYEGFGYTAIAKPDRYMERWAPDVYQSMPVA